MAKAYWISFYHQISDPAKMAAYAKLAGPAIESGGGKFLARGIPEHAYEAGTKERATLIEFPSMDAAVAAHASPAYQAALQALEGGAKRDIRFVTGV